MGVGAFSSGFGGSEMRIGMGTLGVSSRSFWSEGGLGCLFGEDEFLKRIRPFEQSCSRIGMLNCCSIYGRLHQSCGSLARLWWMRRRNWDSDSYCHCKQVRVD